MLNAFTIDHARLAADYCSEVRASLTVAELAAVNLRNSAERDPAIDHAADFIDLNDCMQSALMNQGLIREQIGTDDNAGALYHRSRQSVECKMMNVTACLEDIDRHDLSMNDHGYRPLSSYQAALKSRVAQLVDGVDIAALDHLGQRAATA